MGRRLRSYINHMNSWGVNIEIVDITEEPQEDNNSQENK